MFTGTVILKAQPGNPIDPHELKIDDRGNYRYLSVPKSDCQRESPACTTFNIPKTKIFSDCQTNEVSATGTLLYSWKASEHIPTSMIISSYEIKALEENTSICSTAIA